MIESRHERRRSLKHKLVVAGIIGLAAVTPAAAHASGGTQMLPHQQPDGPYFERTANLEKIEGDLWASRVAAGAARTSTQSTDGSAGVANSTSNVDASATKAPWAAGTATSAAAVKSATPQGSLVAPWDRSARATGTQQSIAKTAPAAKVGSSGTGDSASSRNDGSKKSSDADEQDSTVSDDGTDKDNNTSDDGDDGDAKGKSKSDDSKSGGSSNTKSDEGEDGDATSGDDSDQTNDDDTKSDDSKSSADDESDDKSSTSDGEDQKEEGSDDDSKVGVGASSDDEPESANAELAEIAKCESNGDYKAQNPESTASGKYQVINGTWDNYGGYARAKDAPPEVQEAQAAKLYAEQGSKPWNASKHCWG